MDTLQILYEELTLMKAEMTTLLQCTFHKYKFVLIQFLMTVHSLVWSCGKRVKNDEVCKYLKWNIDKSKRHHCY